MPVGVELAQPLWLLGVPFAALALLAVRYPYWKAASRLGRGPLRQEARRTALRLAWTSLLLLALADVTVLRYLPRQAVVMVADVSASLTPARDQVERAAAVAAANVRSGDLMGVVAVGASAQVEEVPSETPLLDRVGAMPRADGSDLASGLRLAGALVPEGYGGRVVLVSDGQQTAGDAVGAARELTARGLSVDVLPIGSTSPDLVLTHAELPVTSSVGEVATLTATVDAPQATAATFMLYRDDALLTERSFALRSGVQQVAIPIGVGEPGLHRYRVEVVPQDISADTSALNNSLGAIQRVLGPPRVLLVAQGAESAGWLPAALRAAGIDVAIVRSEGVPADLAGWAQYEATVIVDVPAPALPPGAMELLETYVRDLGRGLVMTGGPDSFGPGGYAETPIERALPVLMDVKGRGREPRVALALVIDKSGSMGGDKIEMAKEAAARSIRLLRPEDQAAIIAFDSVPQWVMPLTSLTERDQLETAIGGIYAAGGTDIYPAAAVGFETLREVDADVKHVILLTDGQSGATGDYLALLERMRAARVTLSTVAIGGDADTALLETMARLARGRYHFAANPRAIPQILSSDTLMATRTILVEERFFPAAASSSPILRGLSAVPALDGLVAVMPKDRAEVVLVSPDGDPVVAAWQYGAGRAIAWTPDLGPRWSGGWQNSPSATALWGNAFSWLLPTPETSELTLRAEKLDEASVAIVAENRTAWDEVRPTTATLIGPGGQSQEVEMQPAGPGRYRATTTMPDVGAYVIQATQRLAEGEVRGESGWVAPYPAEYRRVGVDRATLARIAAAGVGQVLADPAEAMRPPDQPTAARWPLAGLLLILAAVGWPLEIAARRLSIPQGARAALATKLRLPAIAPRDGRTTAAPSTQAIPRTPTATAQRLLKRKQAFRELRR